jgi:hypothetical protein
MDLATIKFVCNLKDQVKEYEESHCYDLLDKLYKLPLYSYSIIRIGSIGYYIHCTLKNELENLHLDQRRHTITCTSRYKPFERLRPEYSTTATARLPALNPQLSKTRYKSTERQRPARRPLYNYTIPSARQSQVLLQAEQQQQQPARWQQAHPHPPTNG